MWQTESKVQSGDIRMLDAMDGKSDINVGKIVLGRLTEIVQQTITQP